MQSGLRGVCFFTKNKWRLPLMIPPPTSLSKRGPKKLRNAGLKELQAYLKRTLKEHESQYEKLAPSASSKISNMKDKRKSGAKNASPSTAISDVNISKMEFAAPFGPVNIRITGAGGVNSSREENISWPFARDIIEISTKIPLNRIGRDT